MQPCISKKGTTGKYTSFRSRFLILRVNFQFGSITELKCRVSVLRRKVLKSIYPVLPRINLQALLSGANNSTALIKSKGTAKKKPMMGNTSDPIKAITSARGSNKSPSDRLDIFSEVQSFLFMEHLLSIEFRFHGIFHAHVLTLPDIVVIHVGFQIAISQMGNHLHVFHSSVRIG